MPTHPFLLFPFKPKREKEEDKKRKRKKKIHDAARRHRLTTVASIVGERSDPEKAQRKQYCVEWEGEWGAKEGAISWGTCRVSND